MPFLWIRVLLLLIVALPAGATSSLDLSSPNAYAFVFDNPSMDLQSSFTIDMQFQSLSVHQGCLVAKFYQASGSTLDDAYYILVKTDGGIQARIQTTLLLVTLNATGNVHDGQWHHVALVYDTDAEVAELYLDGVLGASAPLLGLVRDNDEAVRLGALRSPGGLTDYFDGYIDELRFWNMARRNEQAGCLSKFTILDDTPGLISYYHFDEGSGTTAFDEISPEENFSFVSGATFNASEPQILSRLSGPGICLCGNVSGLLLPSEDNIVFVGDTLTVPGDDTLDIQNATIILDSSVAAVNVEGHLEINGSYGFLPFVIQFGAQDNAEIMLNGTASVRNAAFSGFYQKIFRITHDAIFDSCQFTSNLDTALFISGGSVGIAHCAFTGNRTAILADGNFDGNNNDVVQISDCSFDSNTGVFTVLIEGYDAVLNRCDFLSNNTEGYVLVASNLDQPVTRLNCDSVNFIENSAQTLFAVYDTQLRAAHSRFLGNNCSADVIQAERAYPFAGETSVMENCIVHSNSGSNILDVYNHAPGLPPNLNQMTITGNTANYALWLYPPAVLRNSIILQNNSATQISPDSAVVSYCITSEPNFVGWNGNFNSDPLFYDYLEDDLRLTAGSPAINRGDPNILYNDTDGTRADIGALTVQNFAPVLESILDVPHDNGRNVIIQWLPSEGDDSRAGITSYSIYRQVNLSILENYELMATIPAAQLEGYGQIVSTLADSNSNGIPYYIYFLRANSVNPLAFWDTPLDSGYSVDNLAPAAPLLAAQSVNNDIELIWNAVPDSDFAFYAIYRDIMPFDPDTVITIYTTTTDTTLLDADLTGGGFAYAVRAVDINDNVSDPSNVVWVPLLPLNAPLGLTISYISGFLQLQWYSVETATNYNIFRADASGGVETLFASTSDTVFVTPLSGDQKFFRVTAER